MMPTASNNAIVPSANSWGTSLTEKDYAALDKCFISREVAEDAGLRRVTDQEARELLGMNGRSGSFAGILFPYRLLGTSHTCAYRVRRDTPDVEDHGDKVIERAKYMSAVGGGNRIYFAPGTLPAWISDCTIPIVIVEGEKKTLAMSRVAWEGLGDSAEHPRFVAIGLSGVWSWRGRIGKALASDGSHRDVRGVIPDLRQIALQNREVTILFDANCHTNPKVAEARRALAGWLSAQGARVRLVELKPEPGINGPDDAAAKHGAEYILETLRSALPFESDLSPQVLSADEKAVVQQHPYRGFLRDFEKYAQECAPEVPPSYLTLVGLVLAAGVLAGRLKTDSDLRPNIAGLIVGIQGVGKSLGAKIARRLIRSVEDQEEAGYKKDLARLKLMLKDMGPSDEAEKASLEGEIREMEEQGRPKIIIASQASVEGLLEGLSNNPGGIVDYDEFGQFLKDCSRDHLRSARENLTKALDGNPIVYLRTRGQTVDVPDPILSFWGTINIKSLQEAASNEDLFGGLFSRILFCVPNLKFAIPIPKEGDSKAKDLLIEQIRTWRKLKSILVVFAAGVQDRAQEYAYRIAPFRRGEPVDILTEDEVASVTSIRYATHAQKVAILIAAGENPGFENRKVLVEMRHMVLAIDLVERFRQDAIRLLRHVEPRDQMVADAEKLLAKIRKLPGRDRSYYQRLMRWDARHFGAAIAELERERPSRINWEKEGSTGGRDKQTYFPVLQKG
jgi:hypothetical protein